MTLSLSARIETLRRVPIFAGCSRAELREVALSADEVGFPEGHVLTREGQRGREFFVLVEGTARVTKDGKPLANLHAGDWLGEIAILTHAPRTASAETTSPVLALVLTDQALRRIVEATPRIALRILASVGQRLEHDARS